MTAPLVSDEKFIALWQALGSPQAVSKETGIDLRAVYRRRNNFRNRKCIKYGKK